MITARRRHFIARAVKCFLEQTYQNRELVLFDNGEADILEQLGFAREFIGSGRLIRYYRRHFSGDRTIGELRNAANDVTNGDLIAHRDDDDWYHPDALAYQVKQLGDANVGGFYSCLWWDELSDPRQLWKYDGGVDANAIGSSLIYRRAFWRHRQFISTSNGEDNVFQEEAGGRKFPGVTKAGRAYLIARMHESNTMREYHSIIRQKAEQDPARLGNVWTRIEDKATIDKVGGLLQ
jgi:glycosyltransferase involved in cell wall biosynthesis